MRDGHGGSKELNTEMDFKQLSIFSTCVGLFLLNTGNAAELPVNTVDISAGQNQPQVDRQKLQSEVLLLRQQYAADLKRLRDLDLKLKALEARRKSQSEVSPKPKQSTAGTSTPGPETGKVGLTQKQSRGRVEIPRSVEDLIEVEHPSFDQTFTLESALSYSRYDRTQLTLNGFLALDAIFLGNLAVEGVASDTLTYSLTGRYGISDRVVLNLTAPFVFRTTTYTKGGVGGVATATSEADVTRQPAIGDASLGMSLRVSPDNYPVDWVWNLDLTSPTGEHPYGVPVRVIEKDEQGVTTFSVPEKLPTGSGIWSVNSGLSFVKVSDPAVLFGNLAIGYNRKESFGDLDSDIKTRTPGDIDLGDSISYGLGLAFAMNEKTSLSLSFSHKLTGKTRTRTKGGAWTKVVGSDANSAMFNLGVTQSLGRHWSFSSTVGMGLTDDAPDFTFGLRMPYRF